MVLNRVFLIGFMGSGKSTVGHLLARSIDWQFIDLDHYIEKTQKRTVAEIFASDGEQIFRQIEREALHQVAKFDKVIVATGGGSPCFENNMEFMNREGLTIYLELTPEVLMQRLKDAKASRPLIAGKNEAELLDFIKSKLKEREAYYKKAAVTADATAAGVDSYIKIIDGYRKKY
ncbi:MAG: shikimate kinase [Bacteroidales bacterium]|nr:shikimate kinase [Bacteroidales bacterium]